MDPLACRYGLRVVGVAQKFASSCKNNKIKRDLTSAAPPYFHLLVSNEQFLGCTNTMAGQFGMVDPAIFEDLQARVDEDTAVRDVSCRSSPTRSSF